MSSPTEKIKNSLNELISMTNSFEYTYEFTIASPNKTYNVVKYDNNYYIDTFLLPCCNYKQIVLGLNTPPSIALILNHIDQLGFDITQCNVTNNWTYE